MRTILTLLAVGAALSGCGGATHARGIGVVAVENVYASVALQVGGPYVHVTSIIDDPQADPHLFTARASTGLALARARVVIRNGLGYDAFVDRLLASSRSRDRVVITAGLGGSNPHVWYDPAVVRRVARRLAAALRAADPKHAPAFTRGERRFVVDVDRVAAAERRFGAAHGGGVVASTEPVAAYLLRAAGLHDAAPTQFTRAVEDGTEPPPGAVSEMERLLRGGRVRALLYNSQAVTPITRRARDVARSAGVPVVPVTETLPPGLTWQAWQLRTLRALAAAFGA
jgi:zinc/manganese transport system substrate-binding protein